jgi:hypothetical protein
LIGEDCQDEEKFEKSRGNERQVREVEARVKGKV